MVEEITPHQLKAMIEDKLDCLILDVRQPWEFKICHIKGSYNIPLTVLDNNYDQLPDDKEIITICHHGVRSKQAAFLLKHCGYSRVLSLQGGVDAWARDIEPSMERY